MSKYVSRRWRSKVGSGNTRNIRGPLRIGNSHWKEVRQISLMDEQMGAYTGDSPKLKPATGRNLSLRGISFQGPREGENTALAEELGSIALFVRIHKPLAGVVEGDKIVVLAFTCLGKRV